MVRRIEIHGLQLLHQLPQAGDLLPQQFLHAAQLGNQRRRFTIGHTAKGGRLHFDANESLNRSVVQLACDSRSFGGACAQAQAAEQEDIREHWRDLIGQRLEDMQAARHRRRVEEEQAAAPFAGKAEIHDGQRGERACLREARRQIDADRAHSGM